MSTTTQSLSLRALLKSAVRRAGLADRAPRVYGVTPPVLALASAATTEGGLLLVVPTDRDLEQVVADARLFLAALEGLSGDALRQLHRSATVEAALSGLEATDAGLADRLRQRIAAAIEERSGAYLARHGQHGMAVGAVLFDRARRIRAGGPVGGPLLEALGRAT